MFSENLSAAVLRLCGNRGLSYERASSLCELSARYFGDIARRRTVPSILTLEKLCRGFCCTPNDLLLKPELQQELVFRTAMPVARTCGAEAGRGPVCPQCGGSLEQDRPAYCCRCGQCLSWEYFDSAVTCP